MSKSLGNVLVLHELLERHPPEVLRFLLLRAHYRQPLDWSDTTLAQARATLDGWYGVLRDRSHVDIGDAQPDVPVAIEAALCDDLNTPEAFAVLASLADEARKATTDDAQRSTKAAVLGAGRLLGLLQQDPEAWFKQTGCGTEIDTVWVQSLLDERIAARAAKNFARADEIRAELAEKNIVIEDGAQGTRWKVVERDETAA